VTKSQQKRLLVLAEVMKQSRIDVWPTNEGKIVVQIDGKDMLEFYTCDFPGDLRESIRAGTNAYK
jgi:hypothetical protein